MTDNNSEEIIDKNVIQYLPHFGSILIFLGVTRLIIFYNAFGISVINYLDFSEIITSMFDIISYIVFTVAGTLLYLMMEKDKAAKNEKTKYKTIDKLHNISIMVSSVGIILLLVWLKIITILTLTFWLMAFLSFVFLFFVLVRRINTLSISEIKNKQFILLSFVLLSIVSLSFYSNYEASSIKNDKKTIGVTIIFDNDKALISDSTNYYIGKTKDYVFFYHEKEGISDVYPMSRIKKIMLPFKIMTK